MIDIKDHLDISRVTDLVGSTKEAVLEEMVALIAKHAALRAARDEADLDHVQPARPLRQPRVERERSPGGSQPPDLAMVHPPGRRGEAPRAGLHLHQGDGRAVERHQVDLDAAESGSAREDPVARAHEGALGRPLATAAEAVRGTGVPVPSTGEPARETQAPAKPHAGTPSHGRGGTGRSLHASRAPGHGGHAVERTYFGAAAFGAGAAFAAGAAAFAVEGVATASACSLPGPPTSPRISRRRVPLPTR